MPKVVPIKKTNVSHVGLVPSVRDYFDRVGANVKSPLRATVEEEHSSYRNEVAVIKFDRDGTVTAPPDYEPTEDEQQTFHREFENYEFPFHEPIRALTDFPEQVPSDDLNVFYGRTGKHILMVQQRVSLQDGGKKFVPWTYWSDGKWHPMEPESPLPLFGLEGLRGNAVAFLHEGANSAKVCARGLPEVHPFRQGLEHAAHVGWIGGAHSPQRTDWSELAKAGIQDLYIVADNDPVGMAAAVKISKLLRQYNIKVYVIKFDDHFPKGFDLADEIPSELYVKGSTGADVYVGPILYDMTRPATWWTNENATLPPIGSGRPPRPTYSLRPLATTDWTMVSGMREPMFVSNRDRTTLHNVRSFNSITRQFSNCNVADLFNSSASANVVEAIAYEPGKPDIILEGGKRCINTWMPSRWKTDDDKDLQPWEDFLAYLFPIKDERLDVMRWVATFIEVPTLRMLYALLLVSEVQGVGKTTFCNILANMVGNHNSHFPSAHSLVESQFNGWIVRKRLVVVNEIYEDGNWKAYDRLKSLITDPTIEANEKMIPAYSVTNWAHFILNSNALVPLNIAAQDRRLFVPTVTRHKWAADDWQSFHHWLDTGGFGAIAAWAKKFIEDNGAVKAGASAPDTRAKTQMIEDSRSPAEREIRDLAARAIERGAVLAEKDVEAWIADRLPKQKPPKLQLIRKWLKEAGMMLPGDRMKIKGKQQWALLPKPMVSDGWPDISEHHAHPNDLEDL